MHRTLGIFHNFGIRHGRCRCWGCNKQLSWIRTCWSCYLSQAPTCYIAFILDFRNDIRFWDGRCCKWRWHHTLCRCKRATMKKGLGYWFHMTTTPLWTCCAWTRCSRGIEGISKSCRSCLFPATFCDMLVRSRFDCWQSWTQRDVWRCLLFRGLSNHHYPPKLFLSSSARRYCKNTVVDVLLSVEKRFLAIMEVHHRITWEFQLILHGTSRNSIDISTHWPEGCSGWACRRETVSVSLWATLGVTIYSCSLGCR